MAEKRWSGEVRPELSWKTTEPLRHFKHLVGMHLSSPSATFFRYMTAPFPQLLLCQNRNPEMVGPRTRTQEEGAMAIRCIDVRGA